MTVLDAPAPASQGTRTSPWPMVGLWLLSTATFALVLWLVTEAGFRRFTSLTIESAARALARGDSDRAQALLSGGVVEPWLDWRAVAGFAAVGATVVALAWAGQRRWAIGLPLVAGVLTVGPATDWFATVAQPLVPRPIGEAGESWDVWTALVAGGGFDVRVPVWPYLLGSTLQLLLLCLPLLAAPRATPASPAASWVRASLPMVALVAVVTFVTDASWSSYGQVMPTVLVVLTVVTSAVLLGSAAGRSHLVLAAAVLPGLAAAALFPLTVHTVYYPWTDPPRLIWVAFSALTVAYLMVKERLSSPVPGQAADLPL